MLGGVSFRSPRGLAGHSDGDVITHALIDALLGPVGLGDIGTLFPGRSRAQGRVVAQAAPRGVRPGADGGYELVNADVVLIGQEPKIAAVRKQMQLVLTGTLEVEPDRVSVRATTTDALGFTGRGEGLAAQAVALLQSSSA